VAAEDQNQAVPVPTTLEGASGQQSTMPPEELPRRSGARWALPAALAAGGVLAVVVVMSRPSVAPARSAAVAASPVAAVPAASTSPASPTVAPAPPPPASTSVAIEVRGLPA